MQKERARASWLDRQIKVYSDKQRNRYIDRQTNR